jgi:hypothetical protein
MAFTYNPKYYDKSFQAQANEWWRSLSLNEMKAFKVKYVDASYRCVHSFVASEIAEIYDREVVQVGSPN